MDVWEQPYLAMLKPHADANYEPSMAATDTARQRGGFFTSCVCV